jgi:ribosomal protein S18 acetylase RimI-like enzyme
VANCGYVTAARATGRGVARAMCAHALDEARSLGFRAMQFNFVVSTNERAVRLWQHMGFAIVGRRDRALPVGLGFRVRRIVAEQRELDVVHVAVGEEDAAGNARCGHGPGRVGAATV